MNQTVLALLSVLSIYGLSSLALSRPDTDPQDDLSDIQVSDQSSLPVSPDDDDGSTEA